MPSRNSSKVYVENGTYHIFNRGVDKGRIFKDELDYKYFLRILKEYLTPKHDLINEYINTYTNQSSLIKSLQRIGSIKNYNSEIKLLAFCLMPNHFHLLIKQTGSKSMVSFMRSLQTRYAMYLNKKYSRVGYVFQGRYKAISVTNINYLLVVTNYIHANPADLVGGKSNLADYKWSSYVAYSGKVNIPWISRKLLRQKIRGRTLLGCDLV